MTGGCGRDASLYAIQQRLTLYSHYIIDVRSKHAWTESFKAKSGNEVMKAIAKIIRDDERCPKNLHTDRGKKFYNSDVQKLLKKHSINHYSTYSVMKTCVLA